MSCDGCAVPTGGLYIAGCRQCSLRKIINSPEFFASLRAGKVTPAYAALLCVHGEVAAVHAEVRALAKSIHLGACP
jgi:hypothetical protein